VTLSGKGAADDTATTGEQKNGGAERGYFQEIIHNIYSQ